MRTARLGFEWLLALAISAVALFLFLNGSFFSSWNALHIDLSINLVASHALRAHANPYGPTTLLQRATDLGSPTILVYSQLFTSYIQPPTSALALLPLTTLPWRQATHLMLIVNHVFLLSAIGVGLIAVRPTLPVRWVIAGVCLLLAFYSQIYCSFALGQWDATECLLLAIGLWGYLRDKPAVTGSAVALGAAIKLIPGLLLLYFLWKREYRIVAWATAVGLTLLAASTVYIGVDIWRTYLTSTLPALLKGSTQYANASFGALIARAHTPDTWGGLPEMLSLTEVASNTWARLASLGVGLIALVTVGLVLGRRPALPRGRRPETLVFEYYLIVAVTLAISSVTWEFYVIWLLPLYAAVFLAPSRVLPALPALRWLALAAFVIALIAANYPGDFYLFDRNDFFYHPEWVPGVWVEDRLRLYHTHLDLVLYLRLGALLWLSTTLGLLVLWRRRRGPERVVVTPPEARPKAAAVVSA